MIDWLGSGRRSAVAPILHLARAEVAGTNARSEEAS